MGWFRPGFEPYDLHFLVAAILCEVVATSALRAADGFSRLGPSVLAGVGYALAFYFSLAHPADDPRGGRLSAPVRPGDRADRLDPMVLYRQPLDSPALVGIALILAGVLVIQVFSTTIGHS
jgi:small multidrug resistance pump